MIYRKQNNSTEKRMINKIEGDINNDKIRNEKNMLFTLHSYSLNKNPIKFVKNYSSYKLNKIFKLYSKFLEKKQIIDNFKKWKEKSNDRENNNNDEKKIINKRIKLNDKLIKIIKYNNNNSKENNNINDKLLFSDKKTNIYHRKKVQLNIEDNNSKNIYYNENNKINIISNPNDIISNKENQFFLTEKKNIKFNDAAKDENKYFKQNFIEEKEIHFNKRNINL